MTDAMRSASPASLAGELVPAAMRCWRSARDRHDCTQRRLHQMLAPRGWEMLAPVFDSLLALSESALGRGIQPGVGTGLSGDERMLVDLLDGARSRRACIDCGEGTARALDCSICSTRLMLALATAG